MDPATSVTGKLVAYSIMGLLLFLSLKACGV